MTRGFLVGGKGAGKHRNYSFDGRPVKPQQFHPESFDAVLRVYGKFGPERLADISQWNRAAAIASFRIWRFESRRSRSASKLSEWVWRVMISSARAKGEVSSPWASRST